ncbi:MAG: lytic transglycosylase domain-containing protein [Burkholderiaceae bacterium]|nr:lytic transglycosylase domain-containing protein [Burkholderiaceae bacterium]
MALLLSIARAVKAFAGDVAEGFSRVTRSSVALIGLAVAIGVAALVFQPQWRYEGEARLTAWLTARKVAAQGIVPEPGAIERATAANPDTLPPEQANVALWIARKYRVAPEPLAALVAEAYEAGHINQIDPTLILAVMAVESGFNPFAQSSVGAQGLMQIMPAVHSEKYALFGGPYAAFDPKTNLRVGARVLKECIERTGSVQGGLKYYVGAANLPGDGNYTNKVMAEYARLYQVANGAPAPTQPPPHLADAPAPAPTDDKTPLNVAALP